jgi:hypothetical protein
VKNFKLFSSVPVAVLVLAGCSADTPVAPSSFSSPLAARVSGRPENPAPPPVDTALLYTTLDNHASVMQPVNGVGRLASITTLPADNFVPAFLARGLSVSANGERVGYPQVDGGKQNIELEQGTMDFWFRPNFNSADDNKYTIAGTGDWSTSPRPVGSMHFGKHNKSNQNEIFLIFFDANRVRHEHNVDAASYSWKAGTWQHIVITWDFNVPAGEVNLHLYLNSVELPMHNQVSRGPQPVPAELSSETIYIGSRGAGNINASGLYDEFRIFDSVIKPN